MILGGFSPSHPKGARKEPRRPEIKKGYSRLCRRKLAEAYPAGTAGPTTFPIACAYLGTGKLSFQGGLEEEELDVRRLQHALLRKGVTGESPSSDRRARVR